VVKATVEVPKQEVKAVEATKAEVKAPVEAPKPEVKSIHLEAEKIPEHKKSEEEDRPPTNIAAVFLKSKEDSE
jgi:hypothetical protein